MSYTEKDILKLLNIQAKTLKRIDILLKDSLEEVVNQRQFIARLYREIKASHEEEEQEKSLLYAGPRRRNTSILCL